MSFAPLHNFAQLVPVVHIGKVQVLNRSAGDDHAVILVLSNFREGSIKRGEMIGVGVLRDVTGGVQQLHLYLKGGVGQLAK